MIGGTAKAAVSGDAVQLAGLSMENVAVKTHQEEDLIFGQKSGILDCVSYKRTMNLVLFFLCSQALFSSSPLSSYIASGPLWLVHELACLPRFPACETRRPSPYSFASSFLIDIHLSPLNLKVM